MRIIQMLPELTPGDAVSNDARAIRDILREAGYDTEIYAERVHPRLPEGEGKEIRLMPELAPEDLLIYHASTGTRLNFEVPSFGGRQMMVYHNITPPHFFRWYNNKARKNMEYGYEGIRFLADKMEDLFGCGLWGMRMMFTTENPRECEEVARCYQGESDYTPNMMTRGLYYRGVE